MPDVSSVAVPQKPAAPQPTFQVAARYAPDAVGNVVVDAGAAVSSVNVLGLAVVVFPELFVARTLSVYWPSAEKLAAGKLWLPRAGARRLHEHLRSARE